MYCLPMRFIHDTFCAAEDLTFGYEVTTWFDSLCFLLQLKALAVLQKTGPITPADPNGSSKGALSEAKRDSIRKRVLEGLAGSDSQGRPELMYVQCSVQCASCYPGNCVISLWDNFG